MLLSQFLHPQRAITASEAAQHQQRICREARVAQGDVAYLWRQGSTTHGMAYGGLATVEGAWFSIEIVGRRGGIWLGVWLG